MNTNALNAFQTASGISSAELSLWLRTLLLALLFIWAGWCSYGIVHHVRQHGIDEFELLNKSFRILLLIALGVVLVFV